MELLEATCALDAMHHPHSMKALAWLVCRSVRPYLSVCNKLRFMNGRYGELSSQKRMKQAWVTMFHVECIISNAAHVLLQG